MAGDGCLMVGILLCFLCAGIRSSKKRVSGSSSLSLPDLEAPREDESGQQLMLRAQQQQLLIREESGVCGDWAFFFLFFVVYASGRQTHTLPHPQEQEYYQQRQQAIQQIESTMRDLSVMFQDLHQLVQEQEEMVQRSASCGCAFPPPLHWCWCDSVPLTQSVSTCVVVVSPVCTGWTRMWKPLSWIWSRVKVNWPSTLRASSHRAGLFSK